MVVTTGFSTRMVCLLCYTGSHITYINSYLSDILVFSHACLGRLLMTLLLVGLQVFEANTINKNGIIIEVIFWASISQVEYVYVGFFK